MTEDAQWSRRGGRLNRLRDTLAQRLWGTPGDWINPRRKRFWAVAGLLLYTLAGFLLVPWVARQQIVDIAGEMLQRPVHLDQVRVNPFVLSAEARDFAITETDGTPLLSFDRLYINFQLASLFRWAMTFREITLEQPSVNLVRFPDGATNLGQMLPAAAAERGTGSGPAAQSTSGLPRAMVGELNLIEGSASFTDQVPASPFQQAIGPVNVQVRDISTLPDDSGRQQVAVQTDEDIRIAWEGSLQIEPLQSRGRLSASGPFLPLAYRYFRDLLAVEARSGELHLQFDYLIALDDRGSATADLSDLDLRISDVHVTQNERDVFRLPALHMAGGYLAYPDQRAGAESLTIEAPELLVWRETDGTTNLERLAQTPAGDPAPVTGDNDPTAGDGDGDGDDSQPARPWEVALTGFALEGLKLSFEDETLREPGRLQLSALDVHLDDLSNRTGARFPARVSLTPQAGGLITLEGAVGVLPRPALDVTLQVDGLPLAIVQPYLSDLARVQIHAGTLAGRTQLTVSEEESLGASGELAVTGLSLAAQGQEERLVGWEGLAIDRFTYSSSARALQLSEVTLRQPYVRLLIDADQTTNFQQLMIASEPLSSDTPADDPQPAQPPPPADDGPAPFGLTVGRVSVTAGSADFTDLSLPLPFRTRMTELEGDLTTLDSRSTEPSQMRLDGQIEDFGLARIQGTLKPLGPTEDTDLTLLFRNVALPDLTPYTIRFAGREIADGRMEVDLRYQVKGGRMTGSNSVVISDLALGDRVEHPDAFDLPLGLAIALLKGPDGRINVDIPVEGDVNDPQFRIGGVIAGAVANVITGIVTSPFRLLGRLVGAESVDFDRLEFEPGSPALTPPERQKLEKLTEALALRPQLALNVPGVMDTDADGQALRTLAVRAQVDAALAAQDETTATTVMLGARRREVMEALFTEQMPDADLPTLRDEFQRPANPDTDDPATVLDETAYVAELERRLVAATSVNAAALQALADERAAAVADWLTQQAGVDTDRVRTAPAETTTVNDDGWIIMQLDVAAADPRS